MTRPTVAHRRRPGPGSGPSGDERGAVLAVVALAMVSMLIISAIVIDLGYVRGGASFDQSSADFAALAAGEDLGEGRYVEACESTVSYLNTNNAGMPTIDATDLCADFDATECSPGGTLAQAVGRTVAGRYTVEIRFPVPDTEIADPVHGAGTADGMPCDRLRVLVTSQDPAFLGGIMGRSDYTTTRTATVRSGAGVLRLTPALWMLDPVGCITLRVQGSGTRVIAGINEPGNIVPGVITLDSDGSVGCSSTTTTISSAGQIRAIPEVGPPGEQGIISLNALPPGATSCVGTTACRQSDIPAAISPHPVSAEGRATRAPVDWLWNCKTDYPDYRGFPVADCPVAGEVPPYMDLLKQRLGGSGIPPGYQRFSTRPGGGGCNLPTGTTTVTGNWFVDCNNFGIGNNTTLVFADGNAVFQNGLSVGNGGTLRFNTANPRPALSLSCRSAEGTAPCIGEASAQASFIYLRSGTLDVRHVMEGNRVMVLLGDTAEISMTAGATPRWSAPTEGPFAGLALWGEKEVAGMSMAGGGAIALQGTFFLPGTTLNISGSGEMAQQRAQFISYRLNVTGGAQLRLAPDPSASVSLPPPSASLIR